MKGYFLFMYNIFIWDFLCFGLLVKKFEYCNIVFKFLVLLKFYIENMYYMFKFMCYVEIKDCRNKFD